MPDRPFQRGPARRPLPQEPRQPAGQSAPAPRQAAVSRPASADEARARFLTRFGWPMVQALLETTQDAPQTIDGWIDAAQRVRVKLEALAAPKTLADKLDALARELGELAEVERTGKEKRR